MGHSTHINAITALADLLHSENRPEATQTAQLLASLGPDALATPQQPGPFHAEMRALLAQSPLPAAQALLQGFHTIPWGTNPVSTGPAQPIFAVAELLGDSAPIAVLNLRMGLFYQTANAYYGLHDHPADETYTILAGSAHWTAGDTTTWKHPGDMIHHPSMLAHAFRTGRQGVLAMWRWSGDVSTQNYRMLDDPLVPLAS